MCVMQLLDNDALPHILVIFESATTIEYNIAGIPAGARAVHAIEMLAPYHDVSCTLVANRGWAPSDFLIGECERLAPSLPLTFSISRDAQDIMTVNGEAFIAALAQRHGTWDRGEVLLALADARVNSVAAPETSMKDVRQAARRILAATGKSGDGIVSKYFNRPISRVISGQLLRIRGITPFHASVGTAILGLAMAVALFTGGQTGLIVGALLFQAASIFDGVDGEMARATFRSSKQGAALDSIIDACTNLAFVLGLTVNVLMAGDAVGATAGAISLATLAVGLFVIGLQAKAAGEPLNFDVVKGHLREPGRRSVIKEGLIYLTMRDFYAAACALLVVLGFTHFVLVAFATVALGWFCVSLFVLGFHARRTRHATLANLQIASVRDRVNDVTGCENLANRMSQENMWSAGTEWKRKSRTA